MIRPVYRILAALVILFAAAFLPSIVSAQEPESEQLSTGFREMYQLHFDAARREFAAYQHAHPTDGFGKSAEAATYLFQELDDHGVLTSAFFLDDRKFLNGIDGSPNPARSRAFLDANQQARELARKALIANPRDTASLLVVTMADGMAANYEAILAKHQLASLKFLRKSEDDASRLLAIDPHAYDAYVGVGTANYVIGSLPEYKRAFLWFGGIHGDRTRGMEQVQQASEHGHYLQPFAKILLALASEREHQMNHARSLLEDLAVEFPENPHFAHELMIAESSGPQFCCQNVQR